MAGIYVHIPFCHAKCAYCDFYSTPRTEQAEAVVQGIVREWRERRRELEGREVRTVYFGGGTPSSLHPRLLEAILCELPTAGAQELTIEVNPEDVNPQTARTWRAMGFNRVSMGIQSFDPELLTLIGRRHSGDDAARAYDDLRRAGFENVSCDLIFGLPGQTLRGWDKSLQRLLALAPEHISAYCLSYEPGTRLWAMLSAGRVAESEPELLESMYALLRRRTAEAGYVHYEISSFARPGFHSRHNSSYWDSTPYLGLGPAAHSFDGCATRRANPADIRRYLASCPAYTEETESESERANSIIITRLRTAAGLPAEELPQGCRADFERSARPMLADGRLVLADGRYAIPHSHWFTSDAILRDLII